MKLENLYSGREYRLGESDAESRHAFFIRKKSDGSLEVLEYQLVDEQTQRDLAYNEVDLYEKWREKVWDGDTEDGYDTWREGEDVMDYFTPSDYYDYTPNVYSEFSARGYLNDGECPDYYNKWDVDAENVEEIIKWINKEDEDCYDAELVNDLRSKFGLNKITFIQTLPIH